MVPSVFYSCERYCEGGIWQGGIGSCRQLNMRNLRCMLTTPTSTHPPSTHPWSSKTVSHLWCTPTHLTPLVNYDIHSCYSCRKSPVCRDLPGGEWVAKLPTIFWKCPLAPINTLRPIQDGRHFPDDIFKCIFFNENVQVSLKNSLKFVPKVRIINILALVQTMAWRQTGNKPLSEPMMFSLLTHICITRP